MQAVLGLTFPLPDVFGKDFSSETKALPVYLQHSTKRTEEKYTYFSVLQTQNIGLYP